MTAEELCEKGDGNKSGVFLSLFTFISPNFDRKNAVVGAISPTNFRQINAEASASFSHICFPATSNDYSNHIQIFKRPTRFFRVWENMVVGDRKYIRAAAARIYREMDVRR